MCVYHHHLVGLMLQARQQSVEEVNQRWAAKSHTLLSRITNLEQQLQGQSGDGPSLAGQVRLLHAGPALLVLQPTLLQSSSHGLTIHVCL